MYGVKYHYYVASRSLHMCVISQITYVSPFTHMHVYITSTKPHHEVYSLAGIVKKSPSITDLDIGITVSSSHQISDYIVMSIPGVKSSRKGEGM